MKHTSLFEQHQAAGGKIVDFCGWALPIEYEGIFAEHAAVRHAAGLFDVSHMGEFLVHGSDTVSFIQQFLTNDLARIGAGQVLYSPMCYPTGGTVDDVLVYKYDDVRMMIVVNAVNTDKDGDWFASHLFGDVSVENVSDRIAQLAFQGPCAQAVLQRLTDVSLSEVKFFRFRENVKIGGIPVLLSRTGYTGEDGFELYLPIHDAPKLWQLILETGKEDGVKPAGLGARDLLRFEACLPLYGQEISEQHSPVAAGLNRFICWEKPEFIGKSALLEEKNSGSAKTLIAFEMESRAVPRQHYPIWMADKQVGEVTHGTFSPALQKSIGLGFVETSEVPSVEVGTKLEVEIRQKHWPAAIVAKPFYTKRYKKS